MTGLTGMPALLVNVVTTATIFAILALGLNLQWGYTGLFNFSVAAFWGIGAYVATMFTKAPSADAGLGMNLPYLWITVGGIPIPFPAAIVVAAVVAAVVAVVISIPTLRLREDYLAIATLGLAETVRLVLLNETWLTEGASGTTVPNPIISLDYANLILMVISLLFLGITYWVMVRGINSPWGRVIKGIREDEDATNALGKNPFAFKIQSFVIGSVIMAVAGTLTALQINFLVPKQFNPEWTFFIWIGLLLGGSGNNKGAVLGGLILALLFQVPRYLNQLIPYDNVASNSRLIIMGVLIILIMTFKPEGVLGDPGVSEN